MCYRNQAGNRFTKDYVIVLVLPESIWVSLKYDVHNNGGDVTCYRLQLAITNIVQSQYFNFSGESF